ncbi:MAG: hypothetical protein QOE61_3674, partial [Micromonosporaceae bacterium]|nr:hypothetical protein [Micromonosporaceae bacterium]
MVGLGEGSSLVNSPGAAPALGENDPRGAAWRS